MKVVKVHIFKEMVVWWLLEPSRAQSRFLARCCGLAAGDGPVRGCAPCFCRALPARAPGCLLPQYFTFISGEARPHGACGWVV